eukprot:123052_1
MELNLTPSISQRITIKQTYLIFGYIHEIEKKYPRIINIPKPIIYVLAEFYCLFDEWNEKFCGSLLKIIKPKIITKTKKGNYCSCLFGNEINNKMCNVFNIEFKWKKKVIEFFIGYVEADQLNKFDCHDDALGFQKNRNISLGIWIYKTNSHCALYDSFYDYKTLKHSSTDTFVESDRFMLSFDFVNEQLTIFRNDQRQDSIEFQHKSIIPGVSLWQKGEEIEVTKYTFVQ